MGRTTVRGKVSSPEGLAAALGFIERTQMSIRTVLAFAIVAASFSFLFASGQETAQISIEKKQQQGLPSAEQLVDRYVLAIGGYESVESAVCHECTMSVTSLNNDGITFEYQGLRNRDSYYEQYLGSDGRTTFRCIKNGIGYEKINGNLRELLEKEIAGLVRLYQNRSNASQWVSQCKEAKCDGRETIRGRDAYRLNLTFKCGAKSVKYFDVESGLLVKSTETTFPNGSPEKVTIEILEYENIDDQLIVKKQKVNYGGKVYHFVTDSCEFQSDEFDVRFDFPQSFQAMLDSKK